MCEDDEESRRHGPTQPEVPILGVTASLLLGLFGALTLGALTFAGEGGLMDLRAEAQVTLLMLVWLKELLHL